MADIRLGSIVADIRGSVGDETYARNPSGIYVKARVTPTNPNTDRQAAVRGVITALSQAWSGTLTESQRATWRTYALRHPLTDRWGQERCTSGYNMFVRINSYQYRQFSAIAWTVAPLKAPLWPPQPTFTANAALDTVTIGLPIGAYVIPFDDTRFWLFGGLPVAAGVGFFGGPWRLLGYNSYVAGWASDPWTVEAGWTFVVNQRLWIYLVAQDLDDGALSTWGRASLLVT